MSIKVKENTKKGYTEALDGDSITYNYPNSKSRRGRVGNKGGTDDYDNLFPSCRSCNHYKRSMDLEGFREYLKTLHERIAKNYIVKVGMRYGMVSIKPFEGTFYFEFKRRTER